MRRTLAPEAITLLDLKDRELQVLSYYEERFSNYASVSSILLQLNSIVVALVVGVLQSGRLPPASTYFAYGVFCSAVLSIIVLLLVVRRLPGARLYQTLLTAHQMALVRTYKLFSIGWFLTALSLMMLVVSAGLWLTPVASHLFVGIHFPT